MQGFPTIKAFPPGAVSDSDAQDYQGPREKGAIVQHATQLFEALGGSAEVAVEELTSQAVFDATCGAKQRCTIAFLPDIRDTGKAGREALIEGLKEVQKGTRRVPVVWAAAGSQPAWEEHYDLAGAGFPAVVTLRTNQGEQLGVKHAGKYETAALAKFVTAARRRGEYAEGWPSVVEVTPWDGEEPPPLEEEDDDFDLSAFLDED